MSKKFQMSAEVIAEIKRLKAEDKTDREIAEQLKVSRSTVFKYSHNPVKAVVEGSLPKTSPVNKPKRSTAAHSASIMDTIDAAIARREAEIDALRQVRNMLMEGQS